MTSQVLGNKLPLRQDPIPNIMVLALILRIYIEGSNMLPNRKHYSLTMDIAQFTSGR